MSFTENTPLVTVVTPVYNGDTHLEQCIQSVLSQTYQNWEYVIVNNCSTDRTLEIATRAARSDPRVRVHSNATLVDMGANHNIGISLMSADAAYCKVVHADDFLFPECIERMMEVAIANPSVGIVSSYRLDDRSVNLDGLPYPSTVVSGREICRKFLLDGIFVFGSPSSVLIRADLLRGRKEFMDDVTFFMHGDTGACHEMLASSDFGFVHQVLTFTRREASATDTPKAIVLNSYLPAKIMILKRYGSLFLDEKEYGELVTRRLAEYYRFLGRSLVERKDSEFWRFHSHAMKAIGFPLEYGQLARAGLVEDKKAWLRHPLTTLRRVIGAFGTLRRTSYI
jgi:glycosyltransferase involved in cell wall biosynthesis